MCRFFTGNNLVKPKINMNRSYKKDRSNERSRRCSACAELFCVAKQVFDFLF